MILFLFFSVSRRSRALNNGLIDMLDGVETGKWKVEKVVVEMVRNIRRECTVSKVVNEVEDNEEMNWGLKRRGVKVANMT